MKQSDPNVDRVLNSTKATIEELFSNYGSAGGSIGIIKGGKQHFLNVGHKDVNVDQPPDQNTSYLLSSMTKPITALAVGILVNTKKFGISLTTPVKDILPELETKGMLLRANRELTVADLLDHRSEFIKCTNLWECPDGMMPWQTVDPILALFQKLPSNQKFQNAKDFLHSRNYSNECYALAAAIVEKKTGKPWAVFVRDKIVKPLGLKHTFAGLTEGEQHDNRDNIARSYTVPVGETLKKLKEAGLDDTPTYDKVYEWAVDQLYPLTPFPIPVSQVRRAADKTLESSPIGAAAGMMSSAVDLLKLYDMFMTVYTKTENHSPKARSKVFELSSDVEKVEKGMATVCEHIRTMTRKKGCAYAGGWGTVDVPWNPDGPRTRWPGADGDNARNMETAMKALGRDENQANKAWHFFHNPDQRDKRQELALCHGGNMVGATSFCLLLPSRNTAIVVLCNTRGFFLDAANLSGMLLADCLFHNLSSDQIAAQSLRTKQTAQYIAASYVYRLVQYESRLASAYEEIDCHAVPDRYNPFMGTFYLTSDIYAKVHPKRGYKDLQFNLYRQEKFSYSLRLKRGSSPEDETCSMTFAMPMTELVYHGVGGNNRLDVKDFEITFQAKTFTANGLDRFDEFVWVFVRSWMLTTGNNETADGGGGYDGVDLRPFIFRRVKKSC
ncbi:beta-lactamase/transpeptidase-like protein [Podospora didyma]|uniref:Beta-lactamase/transpeptidase-like protein n=1 Tax=Podospora didyma TaxID=330526 RepID=A0AAE0NG73_9PEZI|nr:beta-lactamase/transpeptidase-like protein [Podospora didyma]